MKWLDGITDSMDMSLSRLQESVMDREVWRAVVHWSQGVGHDWVTELNWRCSIFFASFLLFSPISEIILSYILHSSGVTLLYFIAYIWSNTIVPTKSHICIYHLFIGHAISVLFNLKIEMHIWPICYFSNIEFLKLYSIEQYFHTFPSQEKWPNRFEKWFMVYILLLKIYYRH